MTVKLALLATVSSLAMLGAASAADLPIRNAPPAMVAPAPLWAGAYIGVSGGAAKHDWTFNQTRCVEGGGDTCDLMFASPSVWSDSKTGGIFGVHVGYYWQSNNLVY